MNQIKLVVEGPWFHLRDGWFFEKLPDGNVKIKKTKSTSNEIENEIVLSMDDLKSICLFIFFR